MTNFNAGPAALPLPVLQQSAEAILNYNNTGLSILEIPHRGKLFDNILQETQQLVRELTGLGTEYEVLLMHGGGRLQFSMIPMNFLGENNTAGYIDSGYWAAEAIEYARYYGNVNVLASSKADVYNHLPEWPSSLPADLSYLHFTTNNTIFGTQWHEMPTSSVPLIADMSSDIFSTRRDYSRCAMFYAVAQKNIGPAGVTLVVIHKDMLQRQVRNLPPMLSYATHVQQHSVLNTPPVFAIYATMLTLRWIKEKGIELVEQENNTKAALLYAELERNSLLQPLVMGKDRSTMNVCFTATDKHMEKQLVEYCLQHDITGIEGHRSAGGFRVSLYNAITIQQVQHLITILKDFEKENT